MSTILGILDINDNERLFVNTIGQSIVYDATLQVLGDHNANIEQALAVFVERTTSDHKVRYKLAGNGFLQQRGNQGSEARFRNRKVEGYWDVAFPIKDFGDAIGGDDVSMAYMTVQDLDLYIEGVMKANTNTVRDEVLYRLFNNTQATFPDRIYGNLLIEPLANGDSVVYPPIIGSTTEATRDRYLESGYLASAISDTNNPYRTIVGKLEADFGKRTGGENIATFINGDQVQVTEENLTDFRPIQDNFVDPGDNIDTISNIPTGLPGRVVGRTNGTWVVEWDWIPSDYMMALHLAAPKPLIRRIDETGTGLPTGLALVAEDERFPIQTSTWRHRFGFGVGNRLNGLVLELGTGGTYTIPTAYQ